MLVRQGVVGRTLGPPCLARNEAHFLPHQGSIFRRHVFAETYTHHFQHEIVPGIGDARLRLPVGKRLKDSGADFILNVLRHARLRIRDQADVAPGPIRWLQPADIAGHVNQNHQENADITFSDCR